MSRVTEDPLICYFPPKPDLMFIHANYGRLGGEIRFLLQWKLGGYRLAWSYVTPTLSQMLRVAGHA